MHANNTPRERGSQRHKTPWWRQGPWQWYERRDGVTRKIDPPIFPRDAGFIEHVESHYRGRIIARAWRERG
jgi:hypothetical protein